MNVIRLLGVAVISGLISESRAQDEPSDHGVRQVLSDMVLEKKPAEELLKELSTHADPVIEEVYSAWRVGKVAIAPGETPDSRIVLIEKDGGYVDLLTGDGWNGDPEAAETSRAGRGLRRDLSRLVDVLELAEPDLEKRREAAIKIGSGQDPDHLAELRGRLPRQPNTKTREAFEEAIALSLLENGTPDEQARALETLGRLESVAGRDFIERYRGEISEDDPEAERLRGLADEALAEIKAYEDRVEMYGSLFRGVSTGSVLLIVAYGLAITFGLMGVINMAHGEFIAIGAYTVFVVQNIFAEHFAASLDNYFLVSLPLAFLTAAVFGVLLERSVIRFLYKRPLESLLATWGVSMIIQQGLRAWFGPNNVRVSSPEWLSGSRDIGGVTMTDNRLCVIVFALVVVFITWLLLRRTRIGLQMRATMQNRAMASSLGIPAKRINMFTFAFGSGLAGLAGAFISQLGTVGPEMGRAYIVDSFMVVVAGGVGNLLGTATSALGIGVVDQGLQPVLGPVMGKITVLFAIILFLQWRPGGLFPSRSRSLDD